MSDLQITGKNMEPDADIEQLTREQLISEIKKLRKGIREHRDSTGQDLCWHHPKLWELLPEKTDPKIKVPEWPEFMKGCVRYRMSLDKKNPATW
jgi:hypothetical protein